jgi:choline dehydrogenase-like flavoprotein
MITHDAADVCVVGAGLSGPIVAAELAQRGRRVVALEAGSAPTTHGLVGDEVATSSTGGCCTTSRRCSSTTTACPGRHVLARNRGVGRPYAWSGFAYRFHPSDFRVASEAGAPDGSSVADWPISYEELVRWYERAEELLAVGGVAGENPYEAPRATPYPEPPVLACRRRARGHPPGGPQLPHVAGAPPPRRLHRRVPPALDGASHRARVLSVRPVMAHCVHIDDHEVDLIAQHRAHVAHCPTTALKVAYGVTQIGKMPEMMARGVNVAIGTDGNNASNHPT